MSRWVDLLDHPWGVVVLLGVVLFAPAGLLASPLLARALWRLLTRQAPVHHTQRPGPQSRQSRREQRHKARQQTLERSRALEARRGQEMDHEQDNIIRQHEAQTRAQKPHQPAPDSVLDELGLRVSKP